MTTPTDRDELEPCPFCGSDTCQTREVRWNPVMTKWAVSCVRGCGTDGPAHDTEAEAIAAWNRRPTPQAGDELARENVEYGIAWLRGNLGSAEPEKLLAAADAIERLTASGNDVLRGERADKWQDIASAPKNWVPVLVMAVSEDEREDAEDEEREPVPAIMVARHSDIQPGTWWLCGASMVRVFDPLCWQPLPEPSAILKEAASITPKGDV